MDEEDCWEGEVFKRRSGQMSQRIKLDSDGENDDVKSQNTQEEDEFEAE